MPIRSPPSPPPPAQSLSADPELPAQTQLVDFYKSCMDTDTIEGLGFAPVEDLVATLGGISELGSLGEMWGSGVPWP